jgi:hypothetical protein
VTAGKIIHFSESRDFLAKRVENYQNGQIIGVRFTRDLARDYFVLCANSLEDCRSLDFRSFFPL